MPVVIADAHMRVWEAVEDEVHVATELVGGKDEKDPENCPQAC